ncbi:MAG: putative quinol monooxygenase [Pseudomonadales bacterium]
MIIVTGRLATDPQDVHQLLADLKDGVERSRQEDGCQFYSFALEDEQLGALLTLQIWRDEEALAAHLCSPEIAQFISKWTDRYTVETKLYDATNQRPVGQWHNPELEGLIQASRVASNTED